MRRSSILFSAALFALPLLTAPPAWADGERQAVISWPELPDWPAIDTLVERGRARGDYSAPKAVMGLGLRPSLKAIARINAPPELDLNNFTAGFDVHIAGRFGFGRGRSFALWPEVGYVLSGTGGHYASVGMGIGSQPPPDMKLAFGVIPRAVVGGRESQFAAGVRTSVLVDLVFDDGNAWGVELCHQWTRAGGVDLHEIGFGIALTWLPKRWD